tara:strand:+ start:1661 stop:1987 length:327 start_codon:yes stop_codon:yes gene_type:complete
MNDGAMVRVEHVWNDENDRWIYIEYAEENKIIGLNFMQGYDYDYFKECWAKSNDGLTNFYNLMIDEFKVERDRTTRITFINKCIWAYHNVLCSHDVTNDQYTSKWLRE